MVTFFPATNQGLIAERKSHPTESDGRKKDKEREIRIVHSIVPGEGNKEKRFNYYKANAMSTRIRKKKKEKIWGKNLEKQGLIRCKLQCHLAIKGRQSDSERLNCR